MAGGSARRWAQHGTGLEMGESGESPVQKFNTSLSIQDRSFARRVGRVVFISYFCAVLGITAAVIARPALQSSPTRDVAFGGLGVTAVRPDESFESAYPGRYVTNCKPAPVVGCVCVIDSAGSAPHLAQSISEIRDPNGHIEDIEYSRMLEWMRQTCTAVTQPGSLR